MNAADIPKEMVVVYMLVYSMKERAKSKRERQAVTELHDKIVLLFDAINKRELDRVLKAAQ